MKKRWRVEWYHPTDKKWVVRYLSRKKDADMYADDIHDLLREITDVDKTVHVEIAEVVEK